MIQSPARVRARTGIQRQPGNGVTGIASMIRTGYWFRVGLVAQALPVEVAPFESAGNQMILTFTSIRYRA